MYIICDSGKRIINTNCVPCIGYEKCGAACNPYYRVFAYSGNMGEDGKLRFLVSVHQSEAQAQAAVSYIGDSIIKGAAVIKI